MCVCVFSCVSVAMQQKVCLLRFLAVCESINRDAIPVHVVVCAISTPLDDSLFGGKTYLLLQTEQQMKIRPVGNACH